MELIKNTNFRYNKLNKYFFNRNDINENNILLILSLEEKKLNLNLKILLLFFKLYKRYLFKWKKYKRKNNYF